MKKKLRTGLFFFFQQLVSGIRSLFLASFAVLPYFLRIGQNRQKITESYPDPIASRTPDDLPPKSRGLLFNDIDRCLGCQACQQICPSRCIQVQADVMPNNSKMWVSVFDIDFSQCIFCGLCVEVCIPGSLTHSKQFEAAAYQVQDLIANFGRGPLSSDHQIKKEPIRH
jgi:formate hydrogenlyase subunit 6/NADH:ubiquinone oxidoreductase subunit I